MLYSLDILDGLMRFKLYLLGFLKLESENEINGIFFLFLIHICPFFFGIRKINRSNIIFFSFYFE